MSDAPDESPNDKPARRHLRACLRLSARTDRILTKAALLERHIRPDRDEMVRRLKSLCAQYGQRYFAAVLGVNERSVRRWLTGKNRLDGPAAKLVSVLYDLANAPNRAFSTFDLVICLHFADEPPQD